MTPQDVIDAARSWVGTPFAHQGRIKGKGCDCVGLLVGVAHELGITDFDERRYPPDPSGEELKRILSEQAIPSKIIEPGVIVQIAFDKRQPKHVAIVSKIGDKLGLIHSYALRGKVCEHRLNDMWRARIRGVYRVPGVVY